ncbi:hypothetical protein [Ruminococcus sp.]|uniref:hypothetical protein n=1 Tax=Ruminococcus sp. TaxID=41978 RepID=UPI0025FF21B6|nr:hypothetical protein [Ruminococcus sp.]
MKDSLLEFDINKVLDKLAEYRPIFHNERDFQFELGMYIKEHYECQIRMEFFYGFQDDNKKRSYIDIVAFSDTDKCCIAFELKYKTKKVSDYLSCENERFYLKDQGAQDYGCCDVYSDIQRLELLLKSKSVNESSIINNPFQKYTKNKGYVIFITNDPKYYNKGFKENSLFSDFVFNKDNLNKNPKFHTKGKKIDDTCAAKYKYLSKKGLMKNYEVEWESWNKNNKSFDQFQRVYFEIK